MIHPHATKNSGQNLAEREGGIADIPLMRDRDFITHFGTLTLRSVKKIKVIC